MEHVPFVEQVRPQNQANGVCCIMGTAIWETIFSAVSRVAQATISIPWRQILKLNQGLHLLVGTFFQKFCTDQP